MILVSCAFIKCLYFTLYISTVHLPSDNCCLFQIAHKLLLQRLENDLCIQSRLKVNGRKLEPTAQQMGPVSPNDHKKIIASVFLTGNVENPYLSTARMPCSRIKFNPPKLIRNFAAYVNGENIILKTGPIPLKQLKNKLKFKPLFQTSMYLF